MLATAFLPPAPRLRCVCSAVHLVRKSVTHTKYTHHTLRGGATLGLVMALTEAGKAAGA